MYHIWITEDGQSRVHEPHRRPFLDATAVGRELTRDLPAATITIFDETTGVAVEIKRGKRILA